MFLWHHLPVWHGLPASPIKVPSHLNRYLIFQVPNCHSIFDGRMISFKIILESTVTMFTNTWLFLWGCPVINAITTFVGDPWVYFKYFMVVFTNRKYKDYIYISLSEIGTYLSSYTPYSTACLTPWHGFSRSLDVKQTIIKFMPWGLITHHRFMWILLFVHALLSIMLVLQRPLLLTWFTLNPSMDK